MEKTQQNYANKPPTRHTRNCACSSHRYIVQVHASIPTPLLMLLPEEIRTLRSFDTHNSKNVSDEDECDNNQQSNVKPALNN